MPPIWPGRPRPQAIKHVIWSTLEDTRKWVPLSDNRMPTLQGKYKCPHFDAKGEADQEFTKRGLPVTLLLTTFYWDNAIYFGMGPKKGADGKLSITFPMGDKKMARHCGGGHRQGRVRNLQAGQPVDRQDRGYRRRTPNGRADGSLV